MKGADLAFRGMGATPNDFVEHMIKIFKDEEDRDLVYKCRRNPLLLELNGKEGEIVITNYTIRNDQLVLRVEGVF